MIGHAFYFVGLFLFFISLSKSIAYFKYVDIKEWTQIFKKVTTKDPIKSDYKKEKDYNTYITYGCISVIESLWFICGLLSNSWIVFLAIIGSGVLFNFVNNNISYFLQKIVGTLFLSARSSLIIVLVINHFHLHIDWIELIRSLQIF